MSWITDIKLAWRNLRTRGSLFPFNVIPPDGGMTPGVSTKKPFAESLWVRAAIKHISDPIAAVRVEFYQGTRTSRGLRAALPRRARVAAETPINDAKLETFWSHPAVGIGSFQEFIKATVTWRRLAGEAFWLMGDDMAVPFPEVRETYGSPLILARPDRMRHVVDDAGAIAGWEYTDAKGRRWPLLPEQVVHLKMFNPYDDYRGLGDYESARLEAEGDYAAAHFQKSLAMSNGDQGVYVVAKNGVVDEAQRKAIVAQLREKRELQARGVFRPVFLTGDITVEDPKVRTVDLAFLDGRKMNAAAIFVAFGVPPSMAKSDAASYSIGGSSDFYRLILNTCQPEAAEIASGLSYVSGKLRGQKTLAEFCWDEHPVMMEVRKERLDSFEKLCNRGMPARLASDYLDLGLPRYEGDDVGFVPFSVTPIAGAAMDIPEDPAIAASEPTAPAPAPAMEDEEADDMEDGEDSADPVQQAIRALQTPRTKVSAADARLWRKHMAARQGTIKGYKSAFTRELLKARTQTLRKLDAFEKTRSPQQRAAGVALTFDLASFAEGLKAAFQRAGERALNTAGQQLLREVGKDDPWTMPPAKAQEFLRSRENKLSGIPDDVHQQISSAIQQGLDAGDSIAQIQDRVRGAFNAIGRERAQVIAMTETAAAYGAARQEAMESSGITGKRWLTSGADNVRPAHAAANGQVVAVTDQFEVGGELLDGPGDPNGSPENVINCHCVAIAVDLNAEEPTT